MTKQEVEQLRDEIMRNDLHPDQTDQLVKTLLLGIALNLARIADRLDAQASS